MEFVRCSRRRSNAASVTNGDEEGNYAAPRTSAHPVPGHHPRALERSRVAELQEQQNNEASSPHLVIKVRTACAPPKRKIYEKLLQNSELANAACARRRSHLSRFCCCRAEAHENSNLYSKMRSMTREPEDTDPRAKSAQSIATPPGSTKHGRDFDRFAFKVLSGTFNFDTQEIAADPAT